MTPARLSSALRLISDRILASRRPSRTLVARELRRVLMRMAASEHSVKTVGDLISVLQGLDPNVLIGVSVATSDDNFWSDPGEIVVTVDGTHVNIDGYMSSDGGDSD